jgi:hypothetical protein
MAIIDNHKTVKIDKSFTDNHSEMFAFFDSKGIDVDVCDDFNSFRTFLEGLSKEDYPYNYDGSFSGVIDPGFNLTLKKDNNIIATYAAKGKDIVLMQSDFIDYFKCENSSTSLPAFEGKQFYSSCQWVSKDHRGQKFGMILDHLKKNICFDIFGADIQYAIHKDSFKDYHINGLHYDNSEWFATVPQGNVGGAGEENDKVYNVAWITKEGWAGKLNDVRKLYTS